jgi:hypothetical protein
MPTIKHGRWLGDHEKITAPKKISAEMALIY